MAVGQSNITMIIHVVVGLVVIGVGLLVVLQGAIAFLQKRQLRDKNIFGWLELLPPLQTTERYFFLCIQGVFALLSIEVIASLLWFPAPNHSLWPVWSSWLLFGLVWFGMRTGKIPSVLASTLILVAVVLLLLI